MGLCMCLVPRHVLQAGAQCTPAHEGKQVASRGRCCDQEKVGLAEREEEKELKGAHVLKRNDVDSLCILNAMNDLSYGSLRSEALLLRSEITRFMDDASSVRLDINLSEVLLDRIRAALHLPSFSNIAPMR